MSTTIYFDTETTGLDAKKHRIVSLGLLRVENGRVVSAKEYFFNPQQPVPREALAVHGISDEFLADKPTFAEQLDDIAQEWGRAAVHVAHNASFDVAMLKAELARADRSGALDFSGVVDTLALAREVFPSAEVTLPKLCARLGVNDRGRTLHGSLLDCEILADLHPALEQHRDRLHEKVAEMLEIDSLASLPRLDMTERARVYSALKAFGNVVDEAQAAIRAAVMREFSDPVETDTYAVDYRKSVRTKWERVAEDNIPELQSLDLSGYQSVSTAMLLTWKG